MDALTLGVGALAELLFTTNTEPDTLNDADALAAINRALAACGSDLTVCAAEVGAELAAHPEVACSRYTRCVLLASRLTGVEA